MSETIFIKTHKKNDFTVIDNGFVRNSKLSWKAKGVFAYILSLPTDWSINLEEVKNHSTDGITVLRSAVKELTEQGYIKVSKVKNEKGMFAGTKYEVFETPEVEKSDEEKPYAENLNTENLTLLNTKYNQILNKQNTESNKILNSQNSLSDKSLSLSDAGSNNNQESEDAYASSLSAAKRNRRKTASSKNKRALLTDEEIKEMLHNVPEETVSSFRGIVDSIILMNQINDPKFQRTELFRKNRTKDIVLFMQKTGRTEQEIKNVFNFAVQDNFWVGVIRTVEIFIRNYEKIYQSMYRKQKGRQETFKKRDTSYKSYDSQSYDEGGF